MNWKPTHTLLGVECRLGVMTLWGAAVQWENVKAPSLIPAVIWVEHAKPIIEVGTASFPWVSVEDVPHPTGFAARRWLAKGSDGPWYECGFGGYNFPVPRFTHWCWAEPEVAE